MAKLVTGKQFSDQKSSTVPATVVIELAISLFIRSQVARLWQVSNLRGQGLVTEAPIFINGLKYQPDATASGFFIPHHPRFIMMEGYQE
jgi:hypothetical protein